MLDASNLRINMLDYERPDSQLLSKIQSLNTELSDLTQTNEQCIAELSRIEERLSLAMHGAKIALWDWNLETNEVFYSSGWKTILGYSEDDLTPIIDTWNNLLFDEHRSWVLDKLRDYIEDRINTFDVEMRMRHHDAHLVSIRARAFRVVRESDQKVVRLVCTHVDITKQKQAEQFDEKNAEILELIARGKPASIIYNAIALMYEEKYPGMRCSMLELHGDTLLHGGAPSLPEEYCSAVNGLIVGAEVGSCGTSTFTGKQVLVNDIATDPKWVNLKQFALPHGMRCCWSEPIKDSTGKVLGAFGMYYDYPALPNESQRSDLHSAGRLASIVMERDHNQKKIREMAFTDQLTGLASRAHLYQYLETLIEQSTQKSHTFALLYIDLDNFKNVNDSLGHDVGDSLLKMISIRIKNTSCSADFVARLSGDEFCVLVKNIDDEILVNLARQYLENISTPLELSSRKIQPTCSIGITRFPVDGNGVSTLMKAADLSLYTAKENGKNQYAFYKLALSEQTEHRLLVEQSLRNAIENQELSLAYQPQIDLASKKIVGVEVLSRWCHPQLGEILPIEFIATSERIGMIKLLTEWVLKKACRKMVELEQKGFPDIRMAVNISPIHFIDPDFVSLIRSIIVDTKVNASNLVLEVTESKIQTDLANLTIFKELKALGILLAIDDFGIGYSSLASLKHLSVDYLKIDKYFIDDILNDENTRYLVESINDIGQKLSQIVIAEGVETKEQLEMIEVIGCNQVQGYYFSKPVDANNLIPLLNENRAHIICKEC